MQKGPILKCDETLQEVQLLRCLLTT